MLVCAAFLPLLLQAAPQPDLEDLSARLRRAADIAARFHEEAPNYTGVETYHQRAIVSRWKRGSREAQVSLETRDIVSEYGYSTLKDDPATLREFRKVVSVDNKPVTAQSKARETLTQGLATKDERALRQMLRDFASYGLEGAIADFGQILAMFTSSRLGEYKFQPLGKARLGPDSMIRLGYFQKEGTALKVFEGKKIVRQQLTGELWIRETDSIPLRVKVVSSRETDPRNPMRDETTVDYAVNAAGLPLPAAIVHRQWTAGQLTLEDVLEYKDFKRFSADSVIKFTVEPEQK